MTTGMILDIVVILLLIPTIIYAVILNRRLVALRRSREELSKVVNSFNEATMRAEAGIPKLKKATTEANHTLKDRVEKAQTLRDDLAFMIERAEELAGRLEGAVRSARAEGVVAHVAQAAPTTSHAANSAPPPRTIAAGMGAAGMGAAGMSHGTLPEAAQARNPIMSPATLSAATLAQTAAGFEETAADLRNALGAARAEARVGGPMGLGQPGVQAGGSLSGPMASRAKRGPERPLERPLERNERPAAEPGLDEERSEAERELLKALQSAR